MIAEVVPLQNSTPLQGITVDDILQDGSLQISDFQSIRIQTVDATSVYNVLKQVNTQWAMKVISNISFNQPLRLINIHVTPQI